MPNDILDLSQIKLRKRDSSKLTGKAAKESSRVDDSNVDGQGKDRAEIDSD